MSTTVPARGELPTGLVDPVRILKQIRKHTFEDDALLPPQLLRDPDTGDAPGWHMCLPVCFNTALGIKQEPRSVGRVSKLTWTQGGWISFATGDILYDSSKAYGRWPTALKHVKVCYQIDYARSAALPLVGKKDMGVVRFAVLSPNRDCSQMQRRGNLECDQYDFVELLMTGPNDSVRDILGCVAEGEQQ